APPDTDRPARTAHRPAAARTAHRPAASRPSCLSPGRCRGTSPRRAFREPRRKAAARDDVALAIYTRDLFATMHDDANRAAVAAVPAEALDLVGIALRGPRNVVDRIAKGAVFHA
ncbi:DUF2000 family protein, partial [Microbacterium sp. B19]|uniref:DUF2000 family protein n=1 Tax=Microbacterium sp. B19 TaxID=96765 RepID=UPI0011D25CFC